MKDLISVIIPIYKVENYLRRCVDSVLSQTYSNIEIILIDDGSPDRCGEICDEYAKKDGRIKVIHKENGGLSDARNAGIEIAQGKYITFLDSDDWIHPKYLERLYNLLKATAADISVCNFTRTSREDVQKEESNPVINVFTNLEALEHLTDELYVQMVVAWGKLYKRKLFDGIRFPVGKIHEDEFTTYKLLYKAKRVVVTSEQLLYYWQREDSIMGAGFNIRNRYHAAQAFMERAEFFDKIGLIKARDKTYKSAFEIFRQIIERKDDFSKLNDRDKIFTEFKSLRTKLRKGNYSLIFKVFFELYYLIPGVTRLMYEFYRRIKRFRKNEVDVKL